MFDNIRFIRSDNTALNTDKEMQKLRGSQDISSTVNEFLDADSEFNITGYSDYIAFDTFPTPGIEQTLQLQFFALLHADARYYTRRSKYPSYLILFTYEGCGKLEYRGRSYELGPGDGAVINCMEPHYYHTSGQFWTQSSLHFTGSRAKEYMSLYDNRELVLFHQDINGNYQTELEKLLLVHQNATMYQDILCMNALSTLLTDLLIDKEQKNMVASPAYESIREVAAFILEHYSEHMTLEYLASKIRFSKYHFAREFKRIMGVPPNEYLIQVRVRQAKKFLTFTNMTVSDICHAVGMPSENYFGQVFKARTGMTPGEYRRTNGLIGASD